MKILIDYNGSIVKCQIQGCTLNPYKWIDFKEADKLHQILTFDAFKIIEQEFKKLYDLDCKK